MECYDDRLKSFDDADWPTICPLSTPETLSEAGFYYYGSEDKVACYHCGIGLYHFEPDDEPWICHAQCSPYCSFLHENKPIAFIEKYAKE